MYETYYICHSHTKAKRNNLSKFEIITGNKIMK